MADLNSCWCSALDSYVFLGEEALQNLGAHDVHSILSLKVK